ncbi:hypothetical protein CRM81_11460 [Yersinia kristensenii]|nr:hypothetical protein CRM81_11460 [Yersinia kristensenii]
MCKFSINLILHCAGDSLSHYERRDPDSEYCVIYNYDGQTVEILAFVSMKQDLERVLYRYLMFR